MPTRLKAFARLTSQAPFSLTVRRNSPALIISQRQTMALSGKAFDTEQALQIAYEYVDLQLAKA